MNIESCVNRIWQLMLDSCGANEYLRGDGEVVARVSESALEQRMKVRIKAILEETLRDYHYSPRGSHDVEEYYRDEDE